jgi:hypothetical protein
VKSAPEVSADFLERSNARLARVNALLTKFFAGHEEECAEAKAIAKRMLEEERAIILGA